MVLNIKEKKIAIICFEMVPYTQDWGGSQRVFFYANYLSEHGYDVAVFASKNTNSIFNPNKKSSIKIFHFENRFQKVGLTGLEGSKDTLKRKNKYINILRAILKFSIKKIEACIFNEPNTGAGINSYIWVKTNQKEIIKKIANNKFNDIIISVPPFGLLVPKFLKKIKSHITGSIIIDYRDPWNCWNNSKGFSYFREKKIIKLADKIITTNNNHREEIIKDFNLSNSKVTVVMNGYDDLLWKKVDKAGYRKKSDKLVISYLGNISFEKNNYRDGSNFIDALMKFQKKQELLVRFIGVRLPQKELDRLNKKYLNVEFISNVSPEESYMHMLESDVLLSIHTAKDDSSKFLIGGKIFDYYRSGKVILSINSNSSFEFKFIIENNLGYCVENNQKKITDMLDKIYIDWKNCSSFFNPKLSNNNIEKYSREKQNKNLLSLLK